MGKVLQFVADRLTNIMSGMGTTADRRTQMGYLFTIFTPQEAEAAYRSSWLVRKIVDIPPRDMTREWRNWQAEAADIEKLEAEERRLQLRLKVLRALILSRLYGGGGLLLGTNDSDPMQPLDPEKVGKGGLKYIHVLSRHQVAVGEQILDPADPWFGKPKYFEIQSQRAENARVHPSRFVELVGQKAPEGSFYTTQDWFWGDPIMQSVGEAVKNADLAQAGFADLINEAKIDVVKIPDLMAQAGTAEYQSRFLARLQAVAAGKSTWRMFAIDGEEEWEQKQITWQGIPDMMLAFLNVVAGAADIPITRLLGTSPKGLQSTGDGEERDYHAMVKAQQDEMLAPALDRIDPLLQRSALGKADPDIYYEFGSLAHVNEKEQADIEKIFADAARTYADTGTIPEVALAKMVQNRIVESGQWPGAESAFEEAAKAGAEETEEEEAELEEKAGKVEALRKKGSVTDDQATQLMLDAEPRSLYIQRKLLNGAEFLKWAKAQGFETTVPADELHVTVCFSREAIDWMKAGTDWWEDEKGRLRVKPGGARIVEPLGDKGAIVLLFSSSAISGRHADLMRRGASHDFDEYQPHVTITYTRPVGLDLSAVKPYRGELLFGPEIFEEVDDGWASRLTEAVR